MYKELKLQMEVEISPLNALLDMSRRLMDGDRIGRDPLNLLWVIYKTCNLDCGRITGDRSKPVREL